MIDKSANYDLTMLGGRAAYLDGLYREIRGLLESGALAGKRIAVVGCWSNTRDVNNVLNRLGLSISLIADNNPNRQGVSRLGIVSQSVASLAHEENIAILVLNNSYWRDIREQLSELGFVGDADFFVLFGGEKGEKEDGAPPEASVIDEARWKKICGYAERGYAAYLEIARQYPGRPIWLMHQPSLGDVYIFSLFLPAAMGVRSVAECDCVLLVCKESVKKLAEAIGFQQVVLVSLEEARFHWLSLMRLMGDKLKNVRNAVLQGLNNTFYSLIGNTRVTFRDSVTKYVFHFQEEVAPIYPQFPRRGDAVRAEFERLGLKAGKTVLIAPYAGCSEATISPGQWGRLVSGLRDKGYCVCTNCGGPDESPLPGTVPVFIELRDCVEFAETAGHYIGVRNGLCDVLCMADCRKIVIYETGAPLASRDFFGFENMGLGDGNIIELVNDCIHTDELLAAIAERFA